MKGDLTYKILSALEKNRDEALDLLGAFFVSGLSNIKSMMEESIDEDLDADERQNQDEKKHPHEKIAKHRFYSMVSYLEKDGLIRKTRTEEGTYVQITPKGKVHLKYITKMTEYALPPPQYSLDSQDKRTTIITFDIPETQRRKRDWLRCALKNMEFQMIHKSVWMGEDGICQSFLNDIRQLNLKDHMEIFQINKKGSLKKIELNK